MNPTRVLKIIGREFYPNTTSKNVLLCVKITKTSFETLELFWKEEYPMYYFKLFNRSLLIPHSILESKVCYSEVPKLWYGSIIPCLEGSYWNAEIESKASAKVKHTFLHFLSHHEPNAVQPCDISKSQLGCKACAPPSGLMGWKRPNCHCPETADTLSLMWY